jgi:hypothetical protein
MQFPKITTLEGSLSMIDALEAEYTLAFRVLRAHAYSVFSSADQADALDTAADAELATLGDAGLFEHIAMCLGFDLPDHNELVKTK